MADRQSKDYLAGAPVPESYLKMSLPVVAGMVISARVRGLCATRAARSLTS